MTSTFARFVCRILIGSMFLLPFQSQAGLIGTDQAASRATIANLIDRDDVAAQLQTFGISPEAAKERVAALTDAEVAGLAGRFETQPAGGIAGLLLIAVVGALFYYLIIVPSQAKK
jgi:hypothetical protein